MLQRIGFTPRQVAGKSGQVVVVFGDTYPAGAQIRAFPKIPKLQHLITRFAFSWGHLPRILSDTLFLTLFYLATGMVCPLVTFYEASGRGKCTRVGIQKNLAILSY